MHKPAILGGQKAVPDGMIKPWPPIEDVDRRYVMASLEGGKHTFGPNCVEFEKEFAAWNGNKFAITTNSGTAALHMAVAACGCGAGDHVIVPAYSWSSSVTCVIHHNCIPVFVDMDFDTMNMDVSKIESAITPKTKAILVVHLHGLSVNMDAVLAVARRHNLKVIEDACQAHGARFKGRKVGLWGDCTAFSLNQNKCLCSGEGGMLVTDNEDLYKNARTLWSFGETRSPAESRDYHAYALGWMYRNNDLTAAFGRAQLTRLDRYLETQRRNAAVLLDELKSVCGLILPVEPKGHLHNWYNFQIRLNVQELGWTGNPARLRDAMLKALAAEGVPAGIWQRFILPAMTVFQAKNAYGKGCPWSCPYTNDVVYDPAAFPASRRHLDAHFGMTTPLRAPNGPEAVKAVALGIRKVFENANKLDVDKILK
ncbi:MAG: DegT/DnrJ/EryC1/StrS family aminotransferase [Planctomycetes bacterium]|nr:DegT/DnrJ/EryC1/StrS family aminotransferase [Planctomycetota bacterium]